MIARTWSPPPEGRLVGKGHPAGDFLEAYDWELLSHEPGSAVRVLAHVPDHVRNPRGQLFGGFTGAYVDLIALLTLRQPEQREPTPSGSFTWYATRTMRIDYFAPVLGPTFEIDCRVETRRGKTRAVTVRFFQGDDLAVLAAVTMLEVQVVG